MNKGLNEITKREMTMVSREKTASLGHVTNESMGKIRIPISKMIKHTKIERNVKPCILSLLIFFSNKKVLF